MPTGIRSRASPGRPRALPMIRRAATIASGMPIQACALPTVFVVTSGAAATSSRPLYASAPTEIALRSAHCEAASAAAVRSATADGDPRRRHDPLRPCESAAGQMPQADEVGPDPKPGARGPSRRAIRRSACRARPGSASARGRFQAARRSLRFATDAKAPTRSVVASRRPAGVVTGACVSARFAARSRALGRRGLGGP